MKKEDLQLKQIIDESIDSDKQAINQLDKHAILADAKNHIRQKSSIKQNRGAAISRIFKFATASFALILVAMFSINLVLDSYFAPSFAPDGDANTDSSEGLVVYAYHEAYEYNVKTLSQEELDELDIDYLSLDIAAMSHTLYYLIADGSLSMIESSYSIVLDSGNIASIVLTTIYSTDTFHIKFEELLTSGEVYYNSEVFNVKDGYVNGEYLFDACLMDDKTYIISVESPEIIDSETYLELILQIMGQ